MPRVLIVSLLLCLTVAVPGRAEVLTVGTISNEPVSDFKKFSPFAKRLAGKLTAEGITGGKVYIAGTIEEMVSALRQGWIDLYIDSPLISLAVNQLAGSRMVLRRWKKGVGEYRSVVFTRKNSGITKPTDLVGRVVAFEEKFSTSGYLLPVVTMKEGGLNFSLLESHSNPVPAGKAGFIFSTDDENTMAWVLRDRVDAGAMSLRTFEKQAKSSIDALRVIAETIDVPRHVVNFRKGLKSRLEGAIESVLIAMDSDEGGRKTLADFEKTTRFDAIPEITRQRIDRYDAAVMSILEIGK